MPCFKASLGSCTNLAIKIQISLLKSKEEGNSFTLPEFNSLTLIHTLSRVIKLPRRGKREWIELKDKPEDLKTQMKFLRVGKGEVG